MATLHPNQMIEFSAVSEFLAHYDSDMAKGGLYLDTLAEWELRKVLDFTIKIQGSEERARFQAEVVFCGGGKVGLQMGEDKAGVAAVNSLVHKLRSASVDGAARGPLRTPSLKDDGTIIYHSVADFLADFDTNISAGGTYLESSRPWPPGKSFSLLVHIEGQDEFDFTIQAKILSAEGGLVGLALEADADSREGMVELVDLMRDLEDEPPPEAVLEESRATVKPVWRGLIYATRDATEFVPLEIFEVRPDVRPQTTPFGLMASLSQAKKPLRLEIVNNEITLVFRFKSDGSLVDYQGPNSDEDLLDRLVKASFIDDDLRQELRGYLGEGTSAATLLARRKTTNRQQVMIALGEQVKDAMETIRAAGELPFRVFAEEDEWEAGAPFESYIIAWLDQALRALPPDVVKDLLKTMWKRALKVRSDAMWSPGDLALDDIGRKFVRALDGLKPINEVVAGFDKRHKDRLFRLAIALRTLRIVDVLRAAAPAEQTDSKIDALEKELARLKGADKFTQGGVHWSAHPSMYEAAMVELQRKYGRSSPFARSSQKAARLCQHRIEMAKRAHEYLADDFQRQTYRQETFKAGLLVDTAKLLFQKAQAQISEDNPRGAIELLEMAIELDDKPEHRGKLTAVLQHLKKTNR